jgi:hypothetical protein
MATKPLGYWGCDYNLPLIKDIAETFGEFFENMNQNDTLWLIARIAHEAWQETEVDEPPTDEAEEVRDRLHELSLGQKMALIQALANS